jgi:hypothetical protein
VAKKKEEAKEQGWGNPDKYSSRSKFHYFAGFRSLCGKYGRFAGSFTLEDTNDNHPDNCAACKKRVAKYRASTEGASSPA